MPDDPFGKTVNERLAEIEGAIASSWALKTRAEYEAEFKERIKGELNSYAIKLVVSAVVLLAGSGILFIKAATLEIYQQQNQQVIADLKAQYQLNLAEEQKHFEWQKQHDHGKNYVYLAEFHWNSGLRDKQLQLDLINKDFERAETYFSYAVLADPQQPTSYWELGELHYTYAKNYGAAKWLDLDQAIHYYAESAKLYSDADVLRGWRADAYRTIGSVNLEKARTAANAADSARLVASAQDYFTKARDEYVRAVPESRKYNEDRLAEVEKSLIAIEKGAWKK